MAYIDYLNFDGVDLPLPDSYEVDMEDKVQLTKAPQYGALVS